MTKSDWLARILETPHIERIVPQLPPEVLHKVILHTGLEDCTEFVALATPAQLTRVFDLDLWRSGRPGLDEQLDADRFGLWLEVLMEAGADVAAGTVARVDTGLIVAALAQHVRVFHGVTHTPAGGFTAEICGYGVIVTRPASWDAIAALLIELDAAHHDCFARVMRGLTRLSNAGFELDGLDDLLNDREQDLFDLASAREERRERQGFISPADARAFLKMARDPNTTAPGPIAAAYFRAIEWAPPEDAEAPDALPAETAEAAAVVMDTLAEAGIIGAPRALLTGATGAPNRPRFPRMQTLMQSAAAGDELAFLANVLIAGSAGSALLSRAFTQQEASEAVVATCNLGLEYEADASLGLTAVFQRGWSVLHRDVCLRTTKRIIDVLEGLRSDDDDIDDTRSSLDELRATLASELRAGTPWRAADGLDVIMSLDTPAWAALVGLLGECPVMHATIGGRSAGKRSLETSDFAFIGEKAQVEEIDRFLAALPRALGRES
jgi:hypothetical protein